MSTPTTEHIKQLLSEIPDPEIPAINIIDLGILRDVSWSGDVCKILITPTYSGCPAMKVIEENIRIIVNKIKDFMICFFVFVFLYLFFCIYFRRREECYL